MYVPRDSRIESLFRGVLLLQSDLLGATTPPRNNPLVAQDFWPGNRAPDQIRNNPPCYTRFLTWGLGLLVAIGLMSRTLGNELVARINLTQLVPEQTFLGSKLFRC